MKFGAQGHGVDHDGLLLGSSSRITTSRSRPARSAPMTRSLPSRERLVSDGVLHVFVEDAVLTSAVGDLDHDKVALSVRRVKVALSPAGLDGAPRRDLSAQSRVPNDVPTPQF